MTPKCPEQRPLHPSPITVSLQTSFRHHFFWERGLQTQDCAQSPWETVIFMPPYLDTGWLFLLVIPCPTLLSTLPSALPPQDRLPPPPVAGRPCTASAPALSRYPPRCPLCPSLPSFPLALPSSVALLLCRTGPTRVHSFPSPHHICLSSSCSACPWRKSWWQERCGSSKVNLKFVDKACPWVWARTTGWGVCVLMEGPCGLDVGMGREILRKVS